MDNFRDANNLSAAILAGGLNSRIAAEKALLKIKNIPLIDGIVSLLDRYFSEIIIVTGRASIKNRFPEHVVINDLFGNAGPLAGIHAALSAASKDEVFVFACDMPNLNANLIQDMINHYRQLDSPPHMLIPRHRNGCEPLHAIYSKAAITCIEKQLHDKQYKVNKLFNSPSVVFYDVPGEYLSAFQNINTREDYLKIIDVQ